MTEVMELDPVMRPTIVRRTVPGAIETMNRRTIGGQELLCVFWSVEHAERDMEAGGFWPEDGWKAIERDHTELARVFELLETVFGGPILAYLEPCPEDERLGGVFRYKELVELLERSENEG